MKTFVVADDQSVVDRTREILAEHGFDCPISNVLLPDVAADRLVDFDPELTVVISSAGSDAIADYFNAVLAGTWGAIIVIGPTSDAKLIRQILRREDVADFIDLNDFESELQSTLPGIKTEKNGAGERGQVIACVPACGGCGTSTIAVNIATTLAKQHERCALIDLRLEANDLASIIDLKPVHNLADVCENMPNVDHSMFDGMLAKHECGVHLLAAPKAYGEIAAISAEGIHAAIELAAHEYAATVLDLNHPAHAEQAEALALADQFLLVFRLDFVALQNAHRIIEHFKDLAIPIENVHIVATRTGQPREVSEAKAKEALGVDKLYSIPNDPKNVNLAYNSGVPVVIEKPSCKVSKSLEDLAAHLGVRR